MIKKAMIMIVLTSLIKLLISCCTEEITFTKVNFKAVKFDSYWREVDTFNKDIIFEIYLFEDITAHLNSDYNNINATSCGHDYLNKMDTSTIELRTDKRILFNQDTIRAFDNLWKNSQFKKQISFFEDDINPDFTWIIKVKSDGLSKMNFENGLHNFYFRVKMSDFSVLEDSVSVNIDL